MRAIPNIGTSRKVTVAATQLSITNDPEKNRALAESIVRLAVSDGAQIVLLQELFDNLYFCQDQFEENFCLAAPDNLEQNSLLSRFRALSEELNIVLPISFFEKAGQAFYNSIAVFDCGVYLGVYRKSHIPDGTGYQEKFYFSPGDTGFRVFETTYGSIGIGICWDQWFPETARSLALKGAELLFYPTAIGTEPQDPDLLSRGHWTRVMQGHAGANLMPVICSNRVGTENSITFYGGSFIADHTGKLVEYFGEKGEENIQKNMGYLLHTFDLNEIGRARASWGVFRDRRPELYQPITTLDGRERGGGGGGGSYTPTISSQFPSSLPDRISKRLPLLSKSLPLSMTPKEYYMPPEWDKQSAVWMAWPYRKEIWAHHCLPAQKAIYELISVFARFQPVKLLVRPEDMFQVRERFPVDLDVTLVCGSYDDIWMRDTGPTFLRNGDTLEGNGLVALQWSFNGWGSKLPLIERDRTVNKQITSNSSSSDVSGIQCPYVLEGGSFHTDGNGTFITTEECLLHPNRNTNSTDGNVSSMGRSKEEMNKLFENYLNAKKVIWLPYGVDGDDDTDGHVDNLAAFIAPHKVVLTMPTDEHKSHPQYAKSQKAKEILEQSTDAEGVQLQVVCLPHPTGESMVISEDDIAHLEGGANERNVGTIMAGSYVNFYIGNGFVVIPKYNCPEDQLAQDILQSHFPDRVVIAVNTRSILLGGGNIHCITQQEPLP